ncbi:MAG: hypothetical protein ACLP3R_19280, partial [Candidatus Korobacteraceae bacterium]
MLPKAARHGRQRLWAAIPLSITVYCAMAVLSRFVGGFTAGEVFRGAGQYAVTILTVYSIGIVDYFGEKYVEQTAHDLLLNATEGKAIEAWFEGLFSQRWQIGTALLGAFLGALTLVFLTWSGPLFTVRRAIIAGVAGSALGFSGMHGFYFALRIPTLASVVAKQRMRFYWLRPADTPWVGRISGMFTAMCVGQLIGAALCFPIARLLIPRNSVSVSLVWILWLLVVAFGLGFSFVFPQWKIGGMLRESTRRDMEEIQAVLRAMKPTLLSERAHLISSQASPLVSAYSVAAGAPHTAIDAGSYVKVAASVGATLASLFSHR